MTFSKVKVLLFERYNLGHEKAREKTGGKYLQNTFLINDFYLAIHKNLKTQ